MATNNAINTGMPIGVANGGTGEASLTAHGVLIGEGTSPITALAVASTGSTLMGNTGADPSFTGSPSFSGSVTAGTGLTVTTGNATISAGNLVLPATNSGRTQGTIVIGGNDIFHVYGTDNVFGGLNSGGSITSGEFNTGYGALSMQDMETGSRNSSYGFSSLLANSQGSGNTAIGYNSLINLSGNANYNTCVGFNAGAEYTTTESSNLLFGSEGVTGESNVMRLGTTGSSITQVNQCFIAGTYGVSVGSVANVMTMSSTGQTGTAVITAGSGITVTPGANLITIASSITQGITTLDATTGSATGSTVTIQGSDSNIVTSASGSTLTIALASSPSVSGSVTAGTGFTATTGNITATSGNVVITAGNLTLPSTNSARTQGTVVVGGNNSIHFYGTSNTFTGSGSGAAITTASSSCGYGTNSLQDTTTGGSNTAIGTQSMQSNVGGSSNVCVGALSLSTASTPLGNVILGTGAFNNTFGSPQYNIVLGYDAASSYTASESSNILLGNTGSGGESNVIRIGTTGSSSQQQNKCFIAGTSGVNVGSVATVVTMATGTGQIGTATITAGTGITITPGANSITVAGTVSQGIVTLDATTGSATGTTVTIQGSNSNIVTSATSATLTVALANSPSVSGSVTAGTGFTATTGNVTITSGNLALPSNNGTVGYLTIGGTNFINTYGLNNMFVGQNAGNNSINITTSYENTGIGIQALKSLGNGAFYNVAVGYQAGEALSGADGNCLIGFQSGNSLFSGNYNTALGTNSGSGWVTGTESSNIAIGNSGNNGESNTIRIGTYGTGSYEQNECYIAGVVNASNGLVATVGNVTATAGNITMPLTTSSSSGVFQINASNFINTYGGTGTSTYNTFIGFNAGNMTLTTSSATSNTSLGYATLDGLTTGASNVAVGNQCGFGVSSGSNNVLIGYASGYGLSSGGGNVAIGYLGGRNWTGSESSNICIGSEGSSGDNNIVRIGVQGSSSGQQNICYIAGITGVTVTGSAVLCSTSGQLGTISSAERFKENIRDMGDTTEKLMKLRPVTFNLKADPDKNISHGLIAEELDKVMPELVLYDEDKKPYSIKYHEFPAILLNEIQRLHRRIDELEKRV